MFRFVVCVLTVLIAGAARADSTTGKPVCIEIGYSPALASTPLLVMDVEGWAVAEGLDIHLTRFDGGTAAIQGLVAGKIDVMYGGVGSVLVARAKGVGVSVIANSAVNEMALLAQGDLAGLVKGGLSAKDAIDAFFAQKGRKIKISTQPPGSVPDTVLRYWLQKVIKVDPNKVQLISMGIDKTDQALLAGAVDAAVIREPVITLFLEKYPKAAVLAWGGDMFPGQPGTVVAVRDEFLKEHPAAAAALVRLHIRASELAMRDPVRAAHDAQEYVGKGLIDPAVMVRAMGSPSSNFVADPHAIADAVEKMQAFQKEEGLVNVTVPMSEVFNFTFYDAARSQTAPDRVVEQARR